MDDTGEQLHPNWRALATVHIPLKRFIREGTQQTQQGTHSATSKKKYELRGVDGTEIKDFYENLVKQNEKRKVQLVNKSTTKEKPECSSGRRPTKEKQDYSSGNRPFEVNTFHRYAMENQVDKLKEMNIQNQDINVRDCYGWTALMMAACEGSLEAARYLLELGADREAKDKTGKTAKDLARKKGHFHIEELLQRLPSAESSSSDTSDEDEEHWEPFYCQECQRTFTETSPKQHQTSTVHQFNLKSSPSTNKLQKFNIPPRNRGLQLMVKQGWDKESGLGPSNNGRLYPVKTVIRKQRTGLGIDQAPARVTHFQAFDRAAVQRHKSDYKQKKARNRNDIRREKIVEWKRDRRLRNELN